MAGVCRMKGGRALLEVLHRAGVRYLFGNPGTTEIPTLAELPAYPDITYVLCLHESVAVAMADGYARASGKPGVVSVHTLPGTANSLGNLYNAWRDRIPVVVTAGQKDTRILGHDAFCEAPDLVELPRQFSKLSWQTLSPAQIPEVTVRALKTAMAPPRGPVYVLIPEDHQAAEQDYDIPEPSRFSADVPMRPGAEQVNRAVEMLLRARRPLLMVGNEVGMYGAMDRAVAFADVYRAPVWVEDRRTLNCLTFPNDHPLYHGTFDPEDEMVKRCDVLLALGCQMFMEFSYRGRRLPEEMRVIHVSMDPWEIGKVYQADVALVADPVSALEDLTAALRVHLTPALEEELAERGRQAVLSARLRWERTQARLAARSGNGAITPERLVVELAGVIDENTTVVDEGITAYDPLLEYRLFRKPLSYFKARGGSLGWGLPAALGIKLARPERKVIAYLGDGSTLFAIQALWTGRRYHIPILAIVLDNSTYMAVKAGLTGYAAAGHGPIGTTGSTSGTTGSTSIETRSGGTDPRQIACDLRLAPSDPLAVLDWVSLAHSFGWEARRVADAEELAGALAWATDKSARYPVLLDVVMDESIPAPPG